MKTANLAIVFTDIKGFTERTSRQTHEENQRMLRVHDALLTPVFKGFGGRPIKTIGDAFLVVFDSPTQAVLCGVAIQDRLWDYNRKVLEQEQIHVRVACNMGEVRLEKNDVFGEPVNIAARVEGLADAGEVLFTEAVYLAMNKAEVPSELHGLHELKGIPEKVKVYKVPSGVYRLETTPGASPAPSGEPPPYGGLALAKLSSLAAPDPASLQTQGTTELMAQFSAAAADFAGRAASRALVLSQKSTLVVVGLAAVIVIALGVALFGTTPFESALKRGDFKGARAELKAMKEGSERTFLEGRLLEAQKDFSNAAHQYVASAKAGHRAGFKRLVKLTEDDCCPAREHGARGLASLGDQDGLSALKRLEEATFKDEGADDAVSSIFGCSSKRAARDAISKLERSKE